MKEEILKILQENTFIHEEYNEEGPDWKFTSVKISLDALAEKIYEKIKNISK